MLQEGFPLDSSIRHLDELLNNNVYRVSSEFYEHDLFVCLDETVQPSTVELLHLREHDVFVCLDSALSDQSKVRLSDSGNIHVI